MEDQIVRLLRSAGGPRSTKEMAKCCRTTVEEVLDISTQLANVGKIVKITSDMWCLNPKFGKSNSGPTQFNSTRRPPPPVPQARPFRSSNSSSNHPPIPRPNNNLPIPRPKHHIIPNMNHHIANISKSSTSQPSSTFRNAPPPPPLRPHQRQNRDSIESPGPVSSESESPLSSTEHRVLEQLRRNNVPWTMRQLRASGCPASHSLCGGLAEKGLVIKIEMANEEPMYTFNPKQQHSSNSVSGSLKRPPPPVVGQPDDNPPVKISKPNPILNKISNKIAHDSINKNPISAVIEFGQALGWAVNFNIARTSGPRNRQKFHMRLTMGERTFDAVATNKKQAKQNVSELALRTLHAESSGGAPTTPLVDTSQRSSRDPDIPVTSVTQFPPTPFSSLQGTGFFGKAGRFSYDTYNKLASTVHVSTVGRKVISVFILEDSRSGRVMWSPLSLGTGNRTVNGANINLEGKTVNDSHAEVTARRGFRRLLWKQLRVVSGKEANCFPFPVILQESGGVYRVCEGVKIHVFISTAPCGDSAIFPISEATPTSDQSVEHHPVMDNNKQGLLRSKMESGQGTNPTSVQEDPLTVDGVMMGDQRLKTMSCSDKVGRWNVLGLQGCLLSRFLAPVYMASLTLGCLYHHGHLSRAVCCRYTGLVLPAPYTLNHPLLGCVPGQEAERELGKTNEMSMNWCAGDDKVEVLDGCRGRGPKGVCSRMARVSILQEYQEYSGDSEPDYSQLKESVREYSAAKEAFNQFVRDKNYGVWIRKPVY